MNEPPFVVAAEMFPEFQGFSENVRDIINRTGRIAELPAGHAVFVPGAACENYLLVLSGSVRVQIVSESGREIVLYRVGEGESCVLTTSCLLANDNYEAEAVTESPVRALVLPKSAFNQCFNGCENFRQFVFIAYSTRIHDLIVLVREVAFAHLDKRLAGFLVNHARDGALALTHQTLAVELGSAREVISRLLKEFERQGWVVLDRGCIHIENPQALRTLSAGRGD